MTGSRTALALRRLAAPLRRRVYVAGGLGGVGAALVILGAAAWLARLGAVRGVAWVLWAWLAAVAVVAAVAWATLCAMRAFAPAALARGLEATGRFRAGAIRLLLDDQAGGTSDRLLDAADDDQATRLHAEGGDTLASNRNRLGRLAVTGATVAATGALLLLTARPTGAAGAVWRPDLAWAALVAPIEIVASTPVVDRGESVTLALRATGRRDATLWTRAPGEGWVARVVDLDSLGRGTAVVGPLLGDLHARLAAGGRSSDTVTVTVRLPLFLAALEVTAHYPAYLERDAEPLPFDGDTLPLPQGTRLAVDGRATAELAEAAWAGPAGPVAMTVDGGRFSGTILPATDGTWTLELRSIGGAAIGGADVMLPIRIIPDLPPLVEVPIPGMDTVETSSGQLALVIDASDDHGLRRVVLETRRGTGPMQVRELDLPDPRPERALLNVTVDLAALGLTAGDTLRYRVVATDNAPVPQQGASREMLVIVSTRTELREAQREATREVADQLGDLAEQSRALEQATEDLARTRPRGDEGRRAGAQPMAFDEARRADEVARSQEALNEEVAALEEALRELQRAAEAAGIADSAFARRLEEIRQELARALSPELRERLAALQEALQRLDAPAARDALQQLTEAQRQMREALERSRELFERAALEGELGSLSQEARELAEAQQEWADRVLGADSARAAEAERALAQRADSVAAGIERAAEQMQSSSAREEMEQAADAARSAAEQMRQAAQSAQQGQRQQAQQQGRQAASRMGEVQQQVDDSRSQQQEEWREEILEALDQALLETTRLTSRQLAVSQQFRRAQPAAALRAEQASIEEGVRQLIEQVMEAGGRNALVPPQIAGALAAARQQMGQAREAIATANLNLREGGERAGEAVDALNVAAFMLLRARGDVSGSSSGSGMAEAMERMAQMAQQQGGIGQESASLLPMMGAAGTEQRLQELAARQRQLGRDLDRLRAETNAGAAGDFAEEARELARELEAGRLDPATIARQERLFRRMLDAGRTLQGEEEDERKERDSRTATDAEVRLPPAIRARLLDPSGVPRLPSWEELQRYTPEERRLVADYFRRLTGGGR